ncbi:MAG: M56 family metallopeptidase [Cyclobacteriaceae bacterium]
MKNWMPIEKLLDALGWTLIHSLWEMWLLALIYGLLVRFSIFKTPEKRYLGGLVFLLLMLIFFIGTFVHFLDGQGSAKVSPQALNFPDPNPDGYFYPLDPLPFYNRFQLIVENQIRTIMPYLVNVWLIGAFFLFLKMLGDLTLLQQLKSRALGPLNTDLEAKLVDLMQLMGIAKPVSCQFSQDIEVPIAFGHFKPVILIPLSLVLRIDSHYLGAIIAHELAHIKRDDYMVNLFQSVLEILFFYHPAFWWINGQVREAREQAADDLAIAKGTSSEDLAIGLAMVANQSEENGTELSMAAHKMYFPTMVRIKRILGHKTLNHTPSPLISKTMIFTCLLSLSLIMGAAYQKSTPEAEPIWAGTTLRNIDLASQPPVMPKTRTLGAKTAVAKQDTLPKVQEEKALSAQLHEDEDFQFQWEVDFNINTLIWDSLPPMPPLSFSPPPVFDINVHFEDSTGFHFDFFSNGFGDSIRNYTQKIIQLHNDSFPGGNAESEKLEAKIKELQKKMAIHQKSFEAKMEEWSKTMAPKIKEFEIKMKEWQEENEPRIKDYEEKMERWAEEQEEKFQKMEEEFHKKEKEMREKIKEKEKVKEP